MEISLPTYSKFDMIHSELVELSEQGQSSTVLQIIASVLSRLEVLDKIHNDPHYWESVCVNLNNLADDLGRREASELGLFDEELEPEDWEMAEQLLDEDF